MEWYQKAAEQGDAAAQCNVGYLYKEGMGVKKNKKEAVKWLRKAAEQGDNIAKMYLKELGIKY